MSRTASSILVGAAMFLAIGTTPSSPADLPDHTYSLVRAGAAGALFIDTKSVETEGTLKSVWVLWVYDPPEEIPEGFARLRPGLVRYEESWTEYECIQHKYLLRLQYEFDSSGSFVAGGANVPEGRPQLVSAGSRNEFVFNAICRGPLAEFGPSLSLSQALAKGLSLLSERSK